MTHARVAFAVLLGVAMLGGVAGSATASVASAPDTTKFCKAAEKINTDSSNASSFTKAKAKKLSTQFKNAAKYAPANLKSAIKNMTNLFDKIAKSGLSNLSKIYNSEAYKKYSSAAKLFFTYTANACSGTS